MLSSGGSDEEAFWSSAYEPASAWAWFCGSYLIVSAVVSAACAYASATGPMPWWITALALAVTAHAAYLRLAAHRI